YEEMSMSVPCHTPVPIVPSVVIFDEPAQVLSAVFSTLLSPSVALRFAVVVAVIAPVPLPTRMLPAVSEVAPIPPRATVRVPVVPPTIGRPVALVRVPDDGVPSAPPLVTNEPAVPTLTPSAVATPVPNPETPVLIGRPYASARLNAGVASDAPSAT